MSSFDTAADALAGTLIEESQLCAALLAVTHREERAIVESDIPTLTSLVDEKEHLLELLATLETERMTALTAIAMAIGGNASTLTITNVADAATPDARMRLMTIREELRETGAALERANTHNQGLLRMSSDLVEHWVQYMKVIISGSLTYAPDGSTHGASGNRVLDRSA